MKTNCLKYIYLLFFFIGSLVAYGQDSEKLLERANQLLDGGQYTEAIAHYREILMEDNLFEAKKGLANCYRLVNSNKKAEYWYKILIHKSPGNPEFQFHYAQLLQKNGNCDEAKVWFTKYASTDKRGLDFAAACEDLSIFTEGKDEYILLQLPFNSELSEFGPTFYKDGIVFTGGGPVLENKSTFNSYTDLYFSKRLSQDEYERPFKLRGKINDNFHDGPASFSPLGDEVWFTRTSEIVIKESEETRRNLTIWKGVLLDEHKWGKIEEFSFNNPNYSVAHPSISKDGSKLYFVSDMPNGYGGTDIYVSYRRDTTWSEPVNLGPSINTISNEVFPFIHPDGTLYFCSDGHAGLGGIDVFYSVNENKEWSKPQNFGAPVNSAGDDITFVIDEYKNMGYFASNRYGGLGGDDLYYFELKIPNPIPQTSTITDAPPTTEIVYTNPAVPKKMALMPGKIINDNLAIEDMAFEYKKSVLSPQAYADLQKVVVYLNENPDGNLIIEAHTDAREGKTSNQLLSEERAQNIFNFLIAMKIPTERLMAQGYGEDHLLNDCDDNTKCSEEEHLLNDRIVFKINLNAMPQDKFGDEPEDSEFVDFTSTTQEVPLEMPVNKKQKTKEKKEKEPKVKKEKEPKEKKVKEPKVKKEKEPSNKKERTKPVSKDKVSKEKKEKKPKEKKVKEEPTEELLPMPTLETTEDTKGMTYKVQTGPYKSIPMDLQQLIQELKASPTIELKGAKDIILFGPFDSIYKSEELAAFLESHGFKTKIVPYLNGKIVKISIDKLKKDGLK